MQYRTFGMARSVRRLEEYRTDEAARQIGCSRSTLLRWFREGRVADVARDHGAEVPFLRPAELATDDQDDSGFTTHAIQWLIDNEGWHADIVILLRPTSPVRDIRHIDAALEMA